MLMEIQTTDLDGHKGVGVVYNNNELLTLAPGQTSASGSLVLAADAAALAKVRTDRSWQPYHKPISPRKGVEMSWSDIEYDPLTTRTAIARIKSLLDRGTAVALGAVYSPAWTMLGPNGAIQAERSGGHTILAVGYTEDDRFLYLDPYPKGSKVRYRGGLPFNAGKVCHYMGVLQTSSVRGDHLMALVDLPLTPFFRALEVISGPLH